MEIDFRPLNTGIVVKMPVISKLTQSGIVKSEQMLADEAKTMDKYLEVLSVGVDVKEINVGDFILPRNVEQFQDSSWGLVYEDNVIVVRDN